MFQSISGPYTYLWWAGNTYFNLILFAGGALAADDKIICLQELCGRDPTFLPLQAKALGGNPSYVLLAFFVFIVVFVSVAHFVLYLPIICAPHLLCLCLCYSMFCVYPQYVLLTLFVFVVVFVFVAPFVLYLPIIWLLTFFVFFVYLPMCYSSHVTEQLAGRYFKRILNLMKRKISFDKTIL